MVNNVVVQVSDGTSGGEIIPLFVDSPPLVSSYNDKIRPILDAVDKLRRLKVTQEGIALPTIVVVGDQSSGKSSVLESLAGISLPRGQGICTRVPLVMRLQHHPVPVPEFLLQFQEKKVEIIDESQICEAINQATVEIAGDRKGISNIPLTLIVKKKGVPDLTMVDLPGITRVPVHDQPEDIYEQISEMVMEHIKAEESIILNVLSAAVDFSTCESIRMSRRVDSTGQRTLAVVTKCDQNPDGLFEKVTSNDVNIGLGYICVRNRINNETYDEARVQEAMLFETHHLLSKIDKSMVGVPVLANRLVEIQSMIISKCLPDIVKKINERLDASVLEFNKLPPKLATVHDAMAAFMHLVESLKESLQKILIRGEFEEYVDDKQMHCNARLVEMLDGFSKELHSSVGFSKNFLVEEMEVLKEVDGIRLPHFVPHSAFLCLLQRKVNDISELPINFINKVWVYLETVCIRIFVDHSGNYPQLLSSMKKAAHNAMAKTKVKFVESVVEIIEMEKFTGYTCNPNFNDALKKLMGSHDPFVSVIRGLDLEAYLPKFTIHVEGCIPKPKPTIHVEGYGSIDIEHLACVPENLREQAFDLKMKMTSYWEIVLKRMVDWMALRLQFIIRQLVNTEMRMEIVTEVMANDGGIEKMLAEPPSMAMKRERLGKSVALLRESKEAIEQVVDGIFMTALIR